MIRNLSGINWPLLRAETWTRVRNLRRAAWGLGTLESTDIDGGME